jgi:hypothetical protein
MVINTEASENITIATLLIYQLRPNPSWKLTAKEKDTLYSLLRVLNSTNKSLDDLNTIGYRGIQVSFGGNDETLTVCNGIVETVSASEMRRFNDVDRELEMWIFQTARGNIIDDLYNRILVSEFPL